MNSNVLYSESLNFFGEYLKTIFRFFGSVESRILGSTQPCNWSEKLFESNKVFIEFLSSNMFQVVRAPSVPSLFSNYQSFPASNHCHLRHRVAGEDRSKNCRCSSTRRRSTRWVFRATREESVPVSIILRRLLNLAISRNTVSTAALSQWTLTLITPIFLKLFTAKQEYRAANPHSDKHKFGYELGENKHFHHTTTDEDGVRLGCYGHVLDGQKYSTQYVADSKGYRIVPTHDLITVFPKSGGERFGSATFTLCGP